MPKQTINWGILGPGSISKKFATGLKTVPNATICAVGSRDATRADTFASTFGISRAYRSYETLASDPNVDVIYIGTPHSFHKDHTILCLNAGKHVLCEKPFAINTSEATEMIQTARGKGLFLMEAMWSRYLPTINKTRELIGAGKIGDVRLIQADFGFRAKVNPEGRLFNPSLGGGALLDVGIYPLSLTHMILGAPSSITSSGSIGRTGVDEQTAIILTYDGGEMALLSTAIRTSTPQEATIIGTDGWIKIHRPWWNSDTLTIYADGEELTIPCPVDGNGYNYEAEEVGRCIRSGKLESDIMPLDETLSIMEVMDQIRKQIGLRYPADQAVS